jgi:hypothetical protein
MAAWADSRKQRKALMNKRVLVALVFGALAAAGLRSQSTLFFFEFQLVGGYSTAGKTFEFFSLTPEEAMQRPSLGFDLVKRVSGKTKDIGVLAVQARLASSGESPLKLEPQLYNAFFRYKAGFADIWVGHNRPALGLSYTLDPHAILLPIPAMLGFGYDRDWGVGLHRDFSWGNAAASLTTGSGMPLYFLGNFLASARVSYGVLTRDNYSFGFSVARGNVLETMGYTLLEEEPASWRSASLDASYNWRNFEARVELLYGRREGEDVALLFYRAGWNFLEEGRLKFEVQPALFREAGRWEYKLGTGLTYLFDADLTGRFMVLYDLGRRDARFVVQLYYYKGL